MCVSSRRLRVLALLVAIGFLAAQFHFCIDANTGPSASHLCPVCSATGAALATPAVNIEPVFDASRLEVLAAETGWTLETALAISPRAPPSR
jgi:hypothetical protein